MGVAFFNHKPSGCFWYRIKNPMEALRRNGIDVRMINLNEDVVMDDIKSVQFYGAYPFSAEIVFKYLKEEGKKIVYDADDALDLIEKTNPFYHNVKKDLSSANEALLFADEITVSTEGMKDYMKGKTDKKITVVPNCYVPSEWTYPRPTREGIRIGFSGSATHVGDLITVLPSIKNLQKKYNIKFIISGFGQTDYPEWFKQYRYLSQEEGINELYTLDALLKDINFEWVPFVEFTNFPSTLINMSLDIGICPLRNTPFNNCRSACKALEYNLAGALVLASDTKPYQSEPTSILVKDGEWEEQLEYYINNRDTAKKLHAEHLDWIRNNRDINTKIDLLKSVYNV